MSHLLDQFGVEGAAMGNGRVEDGSIEREEAVDTLTLNEGGNTYDHRF